VISPYGRALIKINQDIKITIDSLVYQRRATLGQAPTRCISSPARGMPIKGGTYAPVVSVHGHAPKRNAIIVDCWGASRQICECEDGHWQLAGVDGDFAAEFVPA
jgi:hypothetical protein